MNLCLFSDRSEEMGLTYSSRALSPHPPLTPAELLFRLKEVHVFDWRTADREASRNAEHANTSIW